MNKLFYCQYYDVLGDYKAFQKVKSTKLIEVREYKSDCSENKNTSNHIKLFLYNERPNILGFAHSHDFSAEVEMIKNKLSTVINDGDNITFAVLNDNKFLNFYRAFVMLKKEINFTFNLILGIEENMESDTYKELLYKIPEIEKCSAVCILNVYGLVTYDFSRKSSELFEEIDFCNELISDIVSEVIKKLPQTNQDAVMFYNHISKQYEAQKMKSVTQFDIIKELDFWENIANGHNKEFCKYLKQLRKTYAEKYKIKMNEKLCDYKGQCSGSCYYCERKAYDLWNEVYSDYDCEDFFEEKIDDVSANITGWERLRYNTDGTGVRTLIIMPECQLECKFCINNHLVNKYPRKGKMTVDKLYINLKKDCVYFEMSGGGITFGGGEPLLQPKFIAEFKRKYPMISIDVQTSLNVPFENIKMIKNCIDVWHIDIKDMNNDIYQKYTGSDNALVKQNLHQLIKSVPSEKLHIRVPIIKGFNTEDDVRKSVSELNKMGLLNIEIFKYTSKGESIYGKNQS